MKLQDCLPYFERPEIDNNAVKFTSASLLQNGDSFLPSGHVLSGTSSGHVLLQDLQTLMPEPYMIFDVSSPVVRIETNGQVIAVGTADGTVSLLDAQLRSNKIIGSIQTHHGGLSDMHLQVCCYL